MAGVLTTSNQETLSPLSVRLTHVFRPGFIQMLNQTSPLWNMFRKVRGVGDQSRAKHHVGRNTGGGFVAESTAIGDSGSQEYINTAYGWAIAQIPFEITDLARAINAASGHSNIDMFRDEMVKAAEDMSQVLEKSLNNVQTGLESNGLPDFLNDGSSGGFTGHGGQLYSEYPLLRSCYVPGANFANNEARMDALESCIVHGTGADIAGTKRIFTKEDQGGGNIDLWLTTPTIEQTQKDVLIANGRWIHQDAARKGLPDQSLGVVRTQGQPRLTHNAKPVVASRFNNAGKIYALDASTWEIQILPQVMNAPGFVRSETDFALVQLAKTGTFTKLYWQIYFQLICRKPHRNGVIDGL